MSHQPLTHVAVGPHSVFCRGPARRMLATSSPESGEFRKASCVRRVLGPQGEWQWRVPNTANVTCFARAMGTVLPSSFKQRLIRSLRRFSITL